MGCTSSEHAQVSKPLPPRRASPPINTMGVYGDDYVSFICQGDVREVVPLTDGVFIKPQLAVMCDHYETLTDVQKARIVD